MNIYLIEKYINKLTKKDIVTYAKSKNINLSSEEVDIIYNHIKNDYKTVIYGNARYILNEIKKEVSTSTYNFIEQCYIKYKDFLN